MPRATTRTPMTDRADVEPAPQDRQLFFDISLDLLCVAGLHGLIRDVNPAWERTLGFSRQEQLGRRFQELVHPDDLAPVAAAVDRLRQGRPTEGFECRIRTKAGAYRWIWWSPAVVIRDGAIFAVARDVTESKLREDSLLESDAGVGLRTEALAR